MRIDLPCCGFKNCRYCFDGNCTKPSEQGKCEYWYILHEEPEIIRCKDCKHHVLHPRMSVPWCKLLHSDMGDNQFCSYAELRGKSDE